MSGGGNLSKSPLFESLSKIHVAGQASRLAFTLAEILITLGIIGVVAALTMPSLITNYQKKQTVVELRKVYSDIDNAIRLSETVNGPSSNWQYPEPYNEVALAQFVKTYHLPYFQGSRGLGRFEVPLNYKMVPMVSGNNLPFYYLLLNNGVILGYFINMDSEVNSGYFWLFADINGYKGPNKMGRDQFVFDPSAYADNRFRVKFWCGGSWFIYVTAEQLMQNNSQYACNASNTDFYRNFSCGRVIELSGWKIPEGYPW